MRTTAVCIIGILWAADGHTVVGQSIIWETESPNGVSVFTPGLNYDGAFGSQLWTLSDVNGDGANDVLVSNPTAPSADGTVANVGFVCILSGLDGSILRQWAGTVQGDSVSSKGPIGDVDNDGAGDFHLWQYDANHVAFQTFVSGATAAFLPISPNAYLSSLFPIGDLNSDGVPDFASSYVGGFTVYAGPAATAALYTKTSQPYQQLLGFPVVPIADVDGDTITDLLVGAPGLQCQNTGIGWIPLIGQAFVFSGATGAQLQQFNGTALCDRFGFGIAAPSDSNGDGVADYVIGAYGSGIVKSYSGQTGALLSSYAILPSTFNMPLPLVSLGDVDGDGYGDYVISEAGFVAIQSGLDHSNLYVLTSAPHASDWFYFGWSIASLGDMNGDGFPEVAIGMPRLLAPTLKGRVRMCSLAPVGVATQGSGCTLGGVPMPHIGVAHPAVSGSPFTINLSEVAPNECAGLILGLSNTTWGSQTLPLELGGIGLPGCSLYTSMDAFFPMPSQQIGPGKGAASFTAGIPPGVTSGTQFFAQWAVENPPGSGLPVRMSRALAITIQ